MFKYIYMYDLSVNIYIYIYIYIFKISSQCPKIGVQIILLLLCDEREACK